MIISYISFHYVIKRAELCQQPKPKGLGLEKAQSLRV